MSPDPTPRPRTSHEPSARGAVEDLEGRPVAGVLSEIASALRDGRSFLVATHVSPDGDAVGSAFALALALERLGKESRVGLMEPLPARWARFSPARLAVVADEQWARRHAGTFDWCVVVDTSEPERLGVLRSCILAPGQRRIAIDHHLSCERGPFEHHLVVRAAPATASLVLALLGELGVPVDAELARLLWVGLATDTGWFRFSNTTPGALRDAAALLDAGDLDVEGLAEACYGAHRVERLRLLGDVLAGLRTGLGGRLVWGVVRGRALADRGVTRPELDGVIDQVRTAEGAAVAALLTELDEGRWKISLRARGSADVERVARRFGGGGHRKAAGARWEGELEALERELERAVAEALGGTASGGAPGGRRPA